MVTLVCLFPLLCSLDGTCRNDKPLEVSVTYAEGEQIAELSWGDSPFPALRIPAVPADTSFGASAPEQFFSAGGTIMPQVMISHDPATGDALVTVHRMIDKPEAFSGAGLCRKDV